MFVARDKEPAALSRMYEKLGFQMAVVYGRRCVRNRGEKRCRPISESDTNPSAFSGFSVRMLWGSASGVTALIGPRRRGCWNTALNC